MTALASPSVSPVFLIMAEVCISVMSPSSHGTSGLFLLIVSHANLAMSFAYLVSKPVFSNPMSMPMPQVNSEMTAGLVRAFSVVR